MLKFMSLYCILEVVIIFKVIYEIRNQKSEIRNQKSEIRNQKSEIRNQKSEIRIINYFSLFISNNIASFLVLQKKKKNFQLYKGVL